MKNAIVEAVIVSFAIYAGLSNIADALRDVHVEMNTKVRIVDQAGNGTP